MWSSRRADYPAPQMEAHFRHNAMFIGGNVRQAVNEVRTDYTPVFLSQVEDLFLSEQMRIDVAVVQVSPWPLCLGSNAQPGGASASKNGWLS